MYIARILYPVEVLGCGKRVGIWFCGCPHRCKGCSNPELWETSEKFSVSLETVMKLIGKMTESSSADGFTITGGEPFFQPDGLDLLTEKLAGISEDILIYTGYTYDELKQMNSKSVDRVLARTAVLIDGRYIREKNTNCAMRGSENQEIHILNEKYRKAYSEYMKQENRIQNFVSGRSVISVGIHKRDFEF